MTLGSLTVLQLYNHLATADLASPHFIQAGVDTRQAISNAGDSWIRDCIVLEQSSKPRC